ncbi:MAG TPA: hypothetical protein VMH37_00700, partial [Candidatus Binataceae bacterium]|nr:hypothetical protein [Candidatus Binataceae bacterium]
LRSISPASPARIRKHRRDKSAVFLPSFFAPQTPPRMTKRGEVGGPFKSGPNGSSYEQEPRESSQV